MGIFAFFPGNVIKHGTNLPRPEVQQTIEYPIKQVAFSLSVKSTCQCLPVSEVRRSGTIHVFPCLRSDGQG